MRSKKAAKAARPFSGVVAGAAVLAGATALFFGMAPDRLPTATARSTNATVRFTVNEGTNIAISRPDNGQSIIMDLHGFLYRIPGNGGAATRITDVFLDSSRPEISPDGTKVAFQGYDNENGGHFHVILVNPDGSGVKKLTEGNWDYREPAWSRDGTKVAFATDRATGTFRPPLVDAALQSYNIWSMDVKTGALKLWNDSVTAEEQEPTWSPDGTEIAYVVANRIEAVNEAGSVRTILPTVAGRTINSPAWAPSGTDIAYIGSGGIEANLFVGNRQITSGQDVFRYTRPQWIGTTQLMYAADGKIRIIDIGTGAWRDVPYTATLEMPDIDGYKKKKFDFDNQRPQQILGIVTPALSPDGKKVVFQALNDLYIMEIGQKPVQITNDYFYEVDPAWSPDGRFLAYSSDKAGTEDIYIFDLMAGTERRLTSLNGAEVGAAWSPDGKTIAFQNQAFETLTIDVATGAIKVVVPALFAPGKPSYSADGNYLILAARMRYSTRFREGHNHILSVNLTTGAMNYYPPGNDYDTITTRGNDGPLFSPDGKWVALVLDGVLNKLPVDNTGKPTGMPIKLNNHATDSISWSGDSKWILYENNGKLRMVNSDGTENVRVPLDLTYRNAEGPSRQVIRAGKFWDGVTDRVQENVDIVIEFNRVASVRPSRGALKGQNVIDARNLFVMPGLWDTHFHREREIRFFADREARGQLAYGMTSTMAPGDVAYSSVENREATKAGRRVGPRGFASGEPIDGSSTHLDHFRPVLASMVPLEMSRMRGLDYDYLKTYVRTTSEVKALVVDAAHKFGIPVGTHLMAPGFYTGVDNTTHLSATQRLGYARTVTDNANVSYADVPAAYANRAVMTTVGGFDVLSNHVCPNTDPRLKIFANWKLPQCVNPPTPDPTCSLSGCRDTRTFARMRDAGAIVLAGTDFPLGSDVFFQLQAEMRQLVFYKQWSPYEALLTSIRNPAEFMGIDKDMGSLEVGKLADIIMVEGNPLENIDDVINVRGTMVNGIYRTAAEIVAPFPTTGNSMAAPTQHIWLDPLPSPASNQKYWWHRPEWVQDDKDGTQS